MKKLKTIVGFNRDRSGAAGAELALVLPFLLIMLVGAIEVGRLLNDYHIVSKGVRDGARFLARQDWSCPSAGPATGSITDAARVVAAKHLVLTGEVDLAAMAGGSLPASPNANDLRVGYWSDSNSITVSVECVAKTNAGITGGAYGGAYEDTGAFVPTIHVEADVPFNFLFGFWNLGELKIDHSEPGIGN